jgi:hypothetical protein
MRLPLGRGRPAGACHLQRGNLGPERRSRLRSRQRPIRRAITSSNSTVRIGVKAPDGVSIDHGPPMRAAGDGCTFTQGTGRTTPRHGLSTRSPSARSRTGGPARAIPGAPVQGNGLISLPPADACSTSRTGRPSTIQASITAADTDRGLVVPRSDRVTCPDDSGAGQASPTGNEGHRARHCETDTEGGRRAAAKGCPSCFSSARRPRRLRNQSCACLALAEPGVHRPRNSGSRSTTELVSEGAGYRWVRGPLDIQ